MALLRIVRTPLLVAVVVAGMFFGIKARYGDYAEYYYVKVGAPRAGQLMRIGADVRESGVLIGTVSNIELHDRRVEFTLQIDPQYQIPASAEAFVTLKTLLGDKFVDIRFDEWSEPFLADGATIKGHVGAELEDALQSGVQVFSAVDANDLATIVHELATGARDHGDEIARGLEAGAALSTVFRQTLRPQLQALRDFEVIFGELRQAADELNELADAVNEGVPVYASPEAQEKLRRALIAVSYLSQHLGDLLIVERRDIGRMMDAGDRVLQTIAERTEGLHNLVHGLYRYVFKLGGPPPVLRDNTAAAPFANFFGGDDFEETLDQVCGALPPEFPEIPACRGRRTG
ncbi:MAG TPA: MlaD family protein [Actinomycetota bacterium]|nr:MlaD family protein [Actinomycetota bacterium]